jgi:hypothetical protein
VLRDVATVNLGNGISGQTLSYAGTASAQDWSIVYWIWPVSTLKGTRYERIILYIQNTAEGTVRVAGPVHGVAGLKGALSSTSAQDRRLLANRTFLVQFAREIVQGQIKQPDTGVNVATVIPAGASMLGSENNVAQLDSSAPTNAASIFQRLHVKVSPTVAAGNPTPAETWWQRLHIRPPTPSKPVSKPSK